MIELRPYQSKVIDGVRSSFLRNFYAPLVVAPTGAGKTVIFCFITQQTTVKGNRVWVLVHRIELLRQTSKALRKIGVDHGIINPKYTPDYRQAAQVASVQTVVNRLDKFAACPPDLIVIDEAHHATAAQWRTVIDWARSANPKCRIVGVTATPERADGAGLGVASGGLFDDLIEGPTVAELIDLGYLVKPIIYAPPSRLDLSKVKTTGGDYDKKQLSEEVGRSGITGDAVEHYAAVCPRVPAVAFCTSRKDAENVAAEFRCAGFNFYAVDGTTDADLREAILNGLSGVHTQKEILTLKKHEITLPIHGVTSCDLISEGTDIPAIGCAILLRPTKSLGLYIQQVGRALRPSKGKDFAIILDHVGNVGSWRGGNFIIKHGLPEQAREWSLEGRKKRAKKSEPGAYGTPVKIMQCSQCFAVHEPAPACTQCGYVYKVKEKGAPKRFKGQLKQITPEEAQKIAKTKMQRIEIGRAKSLEELEAIEKARGYKTGWAAHIWAAKNKKILGI